MSDPVLWGNSSEWTSGTVLLVELTVYGAGKGAQTTKNRVILFTKYWKIYRDSQRKQEARTSCVDGGASGVKGGSGEASLNRQYWKKMKASK